MIFFYLFAFIYASNALHLVSKDDVMNPDNTTQTTLLASIKSNPQLFVEEMQNLDPVALQRVITLLEDLKASSEAEETQLIDDLSAKNTALDQANARVVQKENDLDDANDAVDDANAAVTAAQGVLTTTQQAATAAGTALTNEREDQAGKQAEKDASQTAHDNQIPPLNEEQRVLTEVISMLRGLPDAQQQGMQKVHEWTEGTASNCPNMGCQTLSSLSECVEKCKQNQSPERTDGWNCNLINFCPAGADCGSDNRCCMRQCDGDNLQLVTTWKGWDVYTTSE